MANQEIEIQVRVEKIQELLKFLRQKAIFLGEKHQVDEYFTPRDRDFTSIRPVAEWLRLRDSSGKFSVNYKNWHFEKDGHSNYCDEYESTVSDIEQMRGIFQRLGMKSLVVVDKTRSIWMYEGFEIAIDTVKGLGDFLEIELKADSDGKTPRQVTEDMIRFLKKHRCGKLRRNFVGYPFQLLFPKEAILEEWA